MEKNLRKPMVRMDAGDPRVRVVDEVLAREVTSKKSNGKASADYGILTDYFEIFGEMEEFVL